MKRYNNLVEWIQTTAQTQCLLEQLRTVELNHNFLAIDTEFVRRSTFYAKPCLLQIGWQPSLEPYANAKPTSDQISVALVDLITISNKHIRAFIKQLFNICKERKIIIAMHAPTEDLNLFDQLGIQREFEQLFDTQFAASFLGHKPQISLSDLAQRILNVEPLPSFAQSNWETRPLSPSQATYAALDVILVCQLCLTVQPQLQTQGYWQQALEDMNCLYLQNSAPESTNTYSQNQPQMAKIKAAYRARFAHLMEWKEDAARFLNVPRKWHLSNDALAIIATLGEEDAPPKLQLIMQRLFHTCAKKNSIILHKDTKDLFLQTLELDEFHERFYAAWKALPPYPAYKVPIRLGKQSRQPLGELEKLAQDYAKEHGYPEFAFMKRSWLKVYMTHFAKTKLHFSSNAPCITLGWRAPFFEIAKQCLEKHWPYHIPAN